MKLKGAPVLVTGAGGFIGSHLCEALLGRGAQVTALVRYTSRNHPGNLRFLPPASFQAVEIVYGNIEDSDLVLNLARGKSCIFHLAALIGIPYSYQAPRSTFQANLNGTLNILEAARKHGVEKVVQTSSSEVYGTARYTPMDESHPLQAQSPYAASKIAADKLAESYHLAFQTPVATIRPFNTYGPRQSARAVIPTLLSQALAGGTVRTGSLEPVRDLTEVSDTVEGFIRIAECDAAIGQVINIGTGHGISIGGLMKLIFDKLGIDPHIEIDPQRIRPENSEVMELVCDNRKAVGTLGWKPSVSLEEGIDRTIEWMRGNLDLFRIGTYEV